MIAQEFNTRSYWIRCVTAKISKRVFISACLVSMALQSFIYYSLLFKPFLKTFADKRERKLEVAASSNKREDLFKQLERIESELLSYNPAAEKMGANSAGSYRGQLLAAIDRATLVSKVKLGHLNSLSSSTSRLTVFGSYRTITDFIAQLSYDASSVVVLAVTLSAPKDRTYLPNEILEAQMDLDERAD